MDACSQRDAQYHWATEERVEAIACRPRAAIHLDLDGITDIYRIHGWADHAGHDALYETGLQHALNFFEQMGVQATLFAIARDLDDRSKRDLLIEAVKRGHEIASHSLTHRKLTTLNHAEKHREIFESRERLSAQLGVKVCGFRAPGFEIDREIIELIDTAGYSYDSSLFTTTKFGFKVGRSKLSEARSNLIANRRLVELPLPMYAPLPVPFHPCYSLVLGTWYFRLGLRGFQRTRLPLVLLFHLTDFADPLSNDQLPHWKARLYTLSHMSGAEKRQRCAQMLELVRCKYELVDTVVLLTHENAAADNSS